MTSLRSKFLAFDDLLAAHGVKPCSPWWREGIGAWLDRYEREGVLELWVCAGRGSAKSTALYKLALFFSLFGTFDVPAGETHFAVVLSARKEEAAKGPKIVSAWLRLLGVGFNLAGDALELAEPRGHGIRIVAASVAAASGWRAYAVFKDERSKWPEGGVEDLDASEIDTSAAAMTATHALAPVASAGSAWGAFGVFYEAITGGNDASRHVLGPAPTWVAAPHISEETTRRKERDPKKWAREYASRFQASASSAFELEDIDGALVHPRPDGLRMRAHGIIDAASGGKDLFTFGAVRWVLPRQAAPYLELVSADEVPSRVMREEGARAVVARVVAAFRALGIETVHGDQRDAPYIREAFEESGFTFVQHTWTAQNKPPAVERVRRWFIERSLALPPEPTKLRTELLSFEEKLSPSGQYTFAARGSGHDDYVSLLVTSAMANLEGQLVNEEPDAEAIVFRRGRFAEEGRDPWLAELRRARYATIIKGQG